ncbi:uncharacterized protein [Watersipora subatra]|uniref:uncharacterized protein n=1 Tax=Watersipora subatra TaxID=2589382 RepID=UPI00355BF4FA
MPQYDLQCRGFGAVKKLHLVKRVETVDVHSILDEFPEVFKGVGCLKGDHRISFDPTAEPVNHASGRVPLAILDAVETELKSMEANGIIAKVNVLTPWVNSMVIVEKANGSLCICLDPKDFNMAVMCEHHKIPTIENIALKFEGIKYFSILDMRHRAYLSISGRETKDLIDDHVVMVCHMTADDALREDLTNSYASDLDMKVLENLLETGWPKHNQISLIIERQRKQQREPLLPHSVPDLPWLKVAMNILHFQGKDFLVMVDFFSRYPELRMISKKTAVSLDRADEDAVLKRNVSLPENVLLHKPDNADKKAVKERKELWPLAKLTQEKMLKNSLTALCHSVQSPTNISDRISVLKVNTKQGAMHIVNAYASTLAANAEDRDHFYNQLEGTIRRAGNSDYVILLENMTSKHLVLSLQEVEAIIFQHETDHTVKFTPFGTQKQFSQQLVLTDLKNVQNLDGVPVLLVGKKWLQCRHGLDKNSSTKKKLKDEKASDRSDHPTARRTRNLVQDSIKMSCSAYIHVRRLVKVLGYKVDGLSHWQRRKQAKIIKEEIQKNTLRYEEVYEVTIPCETDHSHHIGKQAGCMQPVEVSVRRKIRSLVGKGVYYLDDMRVHLDEYISKKFAHLTLDKGNRRFFPQDQDVSNHMQLAIKELMNSDHDIIGLDNLVQEWRKENPLDNFHFKHEDLFIFVHQSQSQRQLMDRYGHELCLMDATYKTSKYALSLFFIVVKTNINYQPVASFLIPEETTSNIKKALDVIKEWNPNWLPGSWMTDCSQAEINALETSFPDTTVYLCDFHREQAWDRNLKKYVKNPDDKSMILTLLHKLAYSRSVDEFHEQKEDLNFALEKFKDFKQYINNQWLHEDIVQMLSSW